jgi:hypothetical protein
VLLSVATVSPIAAISVWSLNRTVTQLNDPCARWESRPAGEEGPLTASIGPNDVCRSVSVHGGSKGRAVALAALVPGGLLAASLLAVAGAAWSRRRVVLAGAIVMFAETVVVFTIAPLTLAAGVALLFLARRVAPSVHSRTIMIP